jgi:predicted RNA-binding Zn-ribbon protein involved in translation (DUF1610 family)
MGFWKSVKNYTRGPAVILAGLLLVVFLPVILPIVAIDHWLSQRRILAKARVFTCPACGAVIGVEAIRLAEEAWGSHMAEMHRENPGMRLRRSPQRIVRHLHAICPHCGARYQFIKREKAFIAIGSDTW